MPRPNQARFTNRLIPATLIAAIALAYGNTLRDPFIFDDGNAIVNNPHIRSLWPLSESMTAPPLSVLVIPESAAGGPPPPLLHAAAVAPTAAQVTTSPTMVRFIRGLQ